MRCYYLFIGFFLSILSVKGQTIYDFRLENTEGKTVSYFELKGKELTVIDFWATWCKPCVNSLPKIAGLASTYDPESVSFIGISIDSPRNLSKVRPFAETMGIMYPVLLDTEQQLMQELNITVIPTLVITNAENEVVFIHEGFAAGDEVLLKKEIDHFLDEKN